MQELYTAGAVTCVGKDEELERIVEAIHAAAAAVARLMELTAANTAIVLDSTADYPEGPASYPNWRVVPLYVRFGAESYRDYVDLGPAQFYERLAAATELPSTSQPSPGDFAAPSTRSCRGSSACSRSSSPRPSPARSGARRPRPRSSPPCA